MSKQTINHELRSTRYVPVIGLEVHVELKTESKMFCGCSADYFEKAPNSHTCPVCLGLPGALPSANTKAIDWCVMIALALNCTINTVSKFDRKNYFYPDLPKGFQISQYDLPFGYGGHVTLSNGKKIRIRRVHMEEDTGKLTHKSHPELVSGSPEYNKMLNQVQHDNNKKVSLIDYNRSGVPLVEIVTEPDFSDGTEVKEYLQKLQQTVRFLDVSNADMEKGDMRLEPNISLRKKGEKALPHYKVEVKNINSFRFVEKAIEFELKRQTKLLDDGQTPSQETRGWNEDTGKTFTQRVKEEANDYRYFPEPDIPPIRLSETDISSLKSSLPELPDRKKSRFMQEFELSEYNATHLTKEVSLADYFEKAVVVGKKQNVSPTQIANMIINKKPDLSSNTPENLVNNIISDTQTASIDEDELRAIIDDVLKENTQAAQEYKNGKEAVFQFLIGQVMRAAKRKIDIKRVRTLLSERLQS